MASKLRETGIDPADDEPADKVTIDKAEHEASAAELTKLRAAEAKRIKDATAAEEADAIKRGETSKLYETEKAARTAAEARAEAAEARAAEADKAEAKRIKAIDVKNAERVAKIPKERATLVPASLKGEALADYLDVNDALLFGEDKPAGGRRSTRTTDADPAIPAEIVAEAALYSKEPAAWWAIVKKSNPARFKKLSDAGVN